MCIRDRKYFDLKEFWHIGREIPRDSKYAADMPENQWPSEIADFKQVGYGLYQSLDALGSQVLSALALHIGLADTYFADKTDSGNSILRPIHYPPITTDDVPVSYTHLDVYKRQIHITTTASSFFPHKVKNLMMRPSWRLKRHSSNHFLPCLPVSYTHLDVYKRQAQRRASSCAA